MAENKVRVAFVEWKKAAIAIDVVLAAGLIALEVLTIRRYQKRKSEVA